MNQPLFSVILPTRNRLEKLRRALSSVQQQSLRDFELIIVDDGSTDGTADFLANEGVSTDASCLPRTIVIRNDTGHGAGAARNQAIRMARGELIAFLDDDDEWQPGYLEKQSERLAAHPQDQASCAAHIEFDEEGKIYRPDLEPLFEYDSSLVYLLTESFVHSMSVLVVRRTAFEEVGLLDNDLQVTHDWDWCARLLISGGSILPPGGSALVKRQIPGGLVTRLRDWYREEQIILEQAFSSVSSAKANRRHILAYRNLLFARIAISRGDFGFGIYRVFSSLWFAPLWSVYLAWLKWRRGGQRKGNAWS